MILCANPLAQLTTHRAAIDAAIQRVLDAGRYVLGPEVAAFEREMAAYLECGHAVGLSSGTDALQLALRAWQIGPGDEVITVSQTAVATVAAIQLSGARPVLVDVDPSTMTMEPERLRRAITSRTRAIVPVHLYGHPADLSTLLPIARAHGLKVLEDCAQAPGARHHGRRVGSWGDAAALSFYPTKNLGALGDGGLLATQDAELADTVRALREYGWRERYVSHLAGTNSRLDELQAAVLRIKLPHLDAENERRRAHAERYQRLLGDTPLRLPVARPHDEHVFHLYVVRCRDRSERDALRQALLDRDVQTIVHYPLAVHQQPAYQSLGGSLTITEQLVGQILSLPLYPELEATDLDAVAQGAIEFFRSGNDASSSR